MIRIRDTLTYETNIAQEDVAWLATISVPPTVSEMNRWLMEHCTHQWVDDWIDIDVEATQKITYCVVCEINK